MGAMMPTGGVTTTQRGPTGWNHTPPWKRKFPPPKATLMPPTGAAATDQPTFGYQRLWW